MKSLGLLLLGGVFFGIHGAPTIGAIRLSQTTAVIGTPTALAITAAISDPSLIANSVNLLQLSADGTATILGTLHDDGLNGDVFAGDGNYSLIVTVNSATAAQLQFQVSAAFKGVLQRVRSRTVTAFVQPANAAQQTLAALAADLIAGDRSSALALVNPSSNSATAIGTFTQQALNFLATLLNSATLLSARGDSRIFQSSFTRSGGALVTMQFDMVPGTNGQWIINSW